MYIKDDHTDQQLRSDVLQPTDEPVIQLASFAPCSQ